MRVDRLLVLVLSVVALLATGCTHYYKVRDPGGSKDYYTTDIDRTKAGAIKVKDKKTGATVTLQSSEVIEISEDEFNAAVKGQ